jgi:hypothetical protein
VKNDPPDEVAFEVGLLYALIVKVALFANCITDDTLTAVNSPLVVQAFVELKPYPTLPDCILADLTPEVFASNTIVAYI